MSKVKVTRPLYVLTADRGVNASGSCSGDRGNVLTVGSYCYVAVCRRGRLVLAVFDAAGISCR